VVKKDNYYKLAWILSWVFQPPLMVPIVLWVITEQVVVLSRMTAWWGVLLGMGILPLLVFVSWYRKGLMSDIEVTKKEERRRMYVVMILSQLLTLTWLVYVGEWWIAKSVVGLLACGAVFSGLNYYWKISVHSGTMAVAIITLNYFWGYRLFGWMFFFLVALMWARVYMKRHSLGQVMMGVLVPYGVLEWMWRVLGL
jgi:membrane-associated phospholipid phosphatase